MVGLRVCLILHAAIHMHEMAFHAACEAAALTQYGVVELEAKGI